MSAPNDSRKGFGGEVPLPVGELIFSERSASAAMNDGPTEMSDVRTGGVRYGPPWVTYGPVG